MIRIPRGGIGGRQAGCLDQCVGAGVRASLQLGLHCDCRITDKVVTGDQRGIGRDDAVRLNIGIDRCTDIAGGVHQPSDREVGQSHGESGLRDVDLRAVGILPEHEVRLQGSIGSGRGRHRGHIFLLVRQAGKIRRLEERNDICTASEHDVLERGICGAICVDHLFDLGGEDVAGKSTAHVLTHLCFGRIHARVISAGKVKDHAVHVRALGKGGEVGEGLGHLGGRAGEAAGICQNERGERTRGRRGAGEDRGFTIHGLNGIADSASHVHVEGEGCVEIILTDHAHIQVALQVIGVAVDGLDGGVRVHGDTQEAVACGAGIGVQ